MKPLKYILLLSICLIIAPAQAQDDAKGRAIAASYLIAECEYPYQQAEAQAFANVVIRAFRANGEVPRGVTIPNVGVSDRQACEQLISQLLILQHNPPSWASLIEMETQRLKIEDRNLHRKGRYGQASIWQQNADEGHLSNEAAKPSQPLPGIPESPIEAGEKDRK